MEEEQTPRRAAIRRDKTEILTDSVNRPVHRMSVSSGNISWSSDGRGDNSHWGGTPREGNRYREQGSRSSKFPALGQNSREKIDKPRRENSDDKSRLCGQRSHLAKNCHICFTCCSSTQFKGNCPRNKTTEKNKRNHDVFH